MLKDECQDGTEADSSTQDEVASEVRRHNTNALVVGSASCQHGYKGACCCNCKYQLKLFCHPLNGGHPLDKIKFGKGSIIDQCGWACINPEICEGKSAIFFDKEHGMCECWALRS